jgi:16S rRNA (uracil1498-N3)-methyltransferase
MARRRFFVDHIEGDRALLGGDDAIHLVRVLRASAGQQYEISDNSALYLAEVCEAARDHVVFRVLHALDFRPPPVRLLLCAALIKFDRFEWLVEKATELGVEAIQPFEAARTEKGLLEAAAKRIERWRRIARESSQQARRVRIPEIHPPIRLASCAGMSGIRYLLEESAGAPPFLSTLPPAGARRPADHIALLTGFSGELRGIGVGNHETDVVSDNTGLRNANRFREGVNANGRGFHIAATFGNVGIADTREIRGDDGEFVLKSVNQGPPHPRGLRVAVQKN